MQVATRHLVISCCFSIFTCMTRPLRIQFPGAVYHVRHRGADHQLIYGDSSDRQGFLAVVADAVDRFDLVVHGYCLMGNHYHLLVSTPGANLARAMRHIDGVHTQRFNRRHERDGALLRGRYRAILVDRSRYLLAVSRYIHRNPLELGGDAPLSQYLWSSYATYVGLRPTAAWLSPQPVLDQFADREAYRRYVESDLAPGEVDVEPFYAQTWPGAVLGDEEFLIDSGVSPETAADPRCWSSGPIHVTVAAIDRAVAAATGTPVDALRQPSPGRRSLPRMLAIALAHDLTGVSHTALGAAYSLKGRDATRSAITRLRRVRAEDPIVDRLYRDVYTQLAGRSPWQQRQPAPFET